MVERGAHVDMAASEQLHLYLTIIVGLCTLVSAVVGFIVHRAANSQDALATEVVGLRLELAELKGKIAVLLERDRLQRLADYRAGG